MDLEEFTTRLQSIASNKPGWLPQIRAVVATTAATKLSAQAEAAEEPSAVEAIVEEPTGEKTVELEAEVPHAAAENVVAEVMATSEAAAVEDEAQGEVTTADYSNASYWSPSPAYDVSELLGDDEAAAADSRAEEAKVGGVTRMKLSAATEAVATGDSVSADSESVVATEEPAVAEGPAVAEEPAVAEPIAQGEAAPTADDCNASYWSPSPAYDVSDLLGDNEAAAGVTEEATKLAEREDHMRQEADEEVAAQQAAAAQRAVSECAAQLDATEAAEEAVGMKASDKQTAWEDTQEVAVASDVEESDKFGNAEDMKNEILRESVEIDAQRGSEKLAARCGLVHASHQLVLLWLSVHVAADLRDSAPGRRLQTLCKLSEV